MKLSTIDLLWLSLVLLVLISVALIVPLSPQDYWWYLRLGKDVAETGAVPTTDAYSFTRAGAPFYYQAWLSALIFWKAWELGGLTLTFLLRTLIVIATYSLLYLLARKAGLGARMASLVVFLAALAGSANWSIRPQLWVYPLFVLSLLVLWNWERGEPRGLWALSLVSLLWVNLHGSFPLLFILGFCFLAFGRGDRKRLAVVLALSLCALLVNPRGLGVVGYVQNMLSAPSNQRFSVEWLPLVNRGWQANLFYLWLLLFAPLTALSPRKMRAHEWALFLVFGWLALSGARYVIWFAFLLAVFTASLLSEWSMECLLDKLRIKLKNQTSQNASAENRALNVLASCLFLLIPFSLLPGFRETWWDSAPRAYDVVTPIKAAEWLKQNPQFEGPLWSDFSFSSYLIFALPSRPVWIDTRFELYSPDQWLKYSAIARASADWQNLLDEEQVRLVMLSFAAEPALINVMTDSSQWREVYRDEDAVIFCRVGSGGCP
jgi:hypothetical protein